jgi:hypothetical protein
MSCLKMMLTWMQQTALSLSQAVAHRVQQAAINTRGSSSSSSSTNSTPAQHWQQQGFRTVLLPVLHLRWRAWELQGRRLAAAAAACRQ